MSFLAQNRLALIQKNPGMKHLADHLSQLPTPMNIHLLETSHDDTAFLKVSDHQNLWLEDPQNPNAFWDEKLKEFKNTKYSFSDMKVKVDGKTAWATFKYSLTAEMGTRKIESGGLGTAVLEKRDGKWRIVHWHSSAPRRAPAPAASPTPKA